MKLNLTKKLGIVLISISIFGILSIQYLLILFSHITFYKRLSLYIAMLLLLCVLFMGIVSFFELIKEETIMNKNSILIKTKFLRVKEKRIPLTSILKVYINLDVNYRYYIKQSKTKDMLKTIVIFKRDGKRIMKFLDQNSILDFNKFVEKLISKGIEVIKIPTDIRSQKEFVEKTLHEEYLRCDKIE